MIKSYNDTMHNILEKENKSTSTQNGQSTKNMELSPCLYLVL